MSNAWIVVADAARARIFKAETPTAGLEPLEALVSPEARLHGQDLSSDRPGRSFDSMGAGRHATDAATAPKEHEAVRFAGVVADHLERGRVGKQFDRLLLVADPRFLGLLRGALSAELTKMVTAEINKDLSKLDRDEIRERLPERV